MAELAYGLAKTTVEGTVSLVKSAIEVEKKLQDEVQQDLMLISDEFEMMQAFLSVAKDRVTDDVTRAMVRQVRNTALDVEDCIEIIVHLDKRSHWVRRAVRSTCCLSVVVPASDLDKVVARIQLLKTRVEAMGQRDMRYGRFGSDPPAAAGTVMHQQRALPLDNNNTESSTFVTARDAEEKQQVIVNLVGLINEINPFSMFVIKKEDRVKKLRVISVFGTTSDHGLMSIKDAYDHQKTSENFKYRAWVKLTHPFHPHKFIRSLLSQFYKNDSCPLQQENTSADARLDPLKMMVVKTNVDILMEEFKKKINQKYLVVLEDVSTIVDWEAVRVYLTDDNNNGSCIIVHTRQHGIACSCVGNPHYVSVLEKFSGDHVAYALHKEHAPEETVWKTRRQWRESNPLVGRHGFLRLNYLRRFGEHRVISIWGMSGVGKSFLVRHEYFRTLDRPHIGRTYSYGWVNVSRPFNLMDLSWNLLLDMNPKYLQHRIMATIKDPVQECRNYLHLHRRDSLWIVIDGLRSTEEWEKTKAALGLERLGACIIVITNEGSVAKHCASRSDFVHNLQGLEVDDAIQIFDDMIRQVNSHQTNLEEKRIIVHKCGGLPKVICAAAYLMAKEYFQLRDSIRRDNLVSVMLENTAVFKTQSLEDLFAWLFSYFRSCPDFLKPCIFYLSIFPLNHIIRRRRLVRRWIAEGYARGDKKYTWEENGDISFSKLVSLSMIIQVPGAITCQGGIPIPLCRVNGFLREYIISRSMEENLVFALEEHSRKSLQRTGRHLAIYKSWDKDVNVFESIDFSRLRSLTVFGEWEPFFISEKMSLLRVLDLEGVSGVADDDVKKMVKRLPLLKFLSLRRCREITRLPDSLGNLKHLQTLDVRDTCVIKLPKSITNVKELEYVRAGTSVTLDDDSGMVPPTTAVAMGRSGDTLVRSWLSKLWTQNRLAHSGVQVPQGIGKLSNLHTLGVVNISAAGEGFLEELKNLTQLHKLGVSGINRNNIQQFFRAISGLAHLASLSLEVQLEEEEEADGCLELGGILPPVKLERLKLYGLRYKLPLWTATLQNLKKLSLQMITLPSEGLRILRGLKGLVRLRLSLSDSKDVTLDLGREAKLELLDLWCIGPTILRFSSCTIQVLRIRCRRVPSLEICGLHDVWKLKQVWLSGPCALKQYLETRIAAYNQHLERTEFDARPAVLRLEETGSSIPWLWSSS